MEYKKIAALKIVICITDFVKRQFVSFVFLNVEVNEVLLLDD